MNQLKPAVLMLVWLSLITGVAYPLLVTGIAQVAFPAQANGSLVMRDG
jgi:K+-transporting ATPase ATPase C chain